MGSRYVIECADKSELKRLEDRVDKFENKLDSQSATIGDLHSTLCDVISRLSVLEGVEIKRADRESSLGHLQVIGQLEEEVERLEGMYDHFIETLEKEKTQEKNDYVFNASKFRSFWHIGYIDGLRRALDLARFIKGEE